MFAPKIAIFMLAIAAFAIGTTEFVTTGLLPNVAHSFSISIPSAGMVTSGYALGVVIGAPLLTVLTIHLPRKTVLVGLMLLFIVGSVVSALSTTFTILMIGRVLSAFAHGAFFGISSIVVSRLVKPEKRASAIALMFTGLTLSNVIGVPLGTLLGHHFGWRSAFWVVSGLGVVGLLGILVFVSHQVSSNISLKDELHVFKKPAVWAALAITTIGFSGLLASFAYVAPMMTRVAGFSSGSLVWLLALYVVGLVVGNLLGGKLADFALMPTIYAFLIALAVILALFTFTAHFEIPAALTLFLLGAVGFGTIAPLQMHVMQKANAAPRLASAANIAAFNLGTAIGVSLSGWSIHIGLGLTSANWVGAMLTGSAVVLLLLSRMVIPRVRISVGAKGDL